MDPISGMILAVATAIPVAVDLWDRFKTDDVEALFHDSAMSDFERLAGGRGGMSQSKRQALTSEALGQIDTEIAQAQAQSQRGSVASGQTGQAFAQEREALKTKMGAQQQAFSSIREQDLEEAARQRQEAYSKAATARDMKMGRSSMPMPDPTAMFEAFAGLGQDKRKQLGSTKPSPTTDPLGNVQAQGVPLDG